MIIVNYNVKYFLEQCLISVLAACEKLPSEVIVVDNNSVDGSEAMVHQKFPSVTYIANDVNLGFSKANNQGIELSKGEYVLLLNPDTVVEDDTFEKTVQFMDEHPDGGGLGVKMIDGKGIFLPESKRGLPTPQVAFYKIFGLSYLFPKSRKLGQYHLGYLDDDEIHSVDVLSGAFMLLRKKALDEVGLLDEAFFMYGEDIDLSYRITQGGYKNYYYPKTRIIHYKGESTKKSSINYVFVFYNAMVIFAQKHFSQKNAQLFSLLINLAIYLRASVAIMQRFLSKSIFPAIDLGIILGGLHLFKSFYEDFSGKIFDESLTSVALPLYALVWITSIFINGGYDQPIRLKKVIVGNFIGTAIILMAYALLDNDYRFSRALIPAGMLWSITVTLLTRLALHLSPLKNYKIGAPSKKRFAIVGDESEVERIESFLNQTAIVPEFSTAIAPEESMVTTDSPFLTDLSKIREAIKIFRINEIIFSAGSLKFKTIIEQMDQLEDTGIDYKIAPEGSEYIIGSNSINASGQLYSLMNFNAISTEANKRNKRMVDIFLSLLLLLLYPIALFFVKKKGQFFVNILSVLVGKLTWVGYARFSEDLALLPVINKGVLHPIDSLGSKQNDQHVAKHMNATYAREYAWWQDIQIVWKGFSQLGRK